MNFEVLKAEFQTQFVGLKLRQWEGAGRKCPITVTAPESSAVR